VAPSAAAPPARVPTSLKTFAGAVPERVAATDADMWASRAAPGRPLGTILRSGRACEGHLAAIGVEADAGLERAGIVPLGKRLLL